MRIPYKNSRRWKTKYFIAALGVILSLLAPAAYTARADEPYFPKLVFSTDRAWNDSVADEYTRNLKAMHEPSLWQLSQGNREVTAYRMLWLRDRGHPIAIRISNSAGKSSLVAVELDSLFRLDEAKPGDIAIRKLVPLTPIQWDRFTGLVEMAQMWSQAPRVTEQDVGNGRLILECLRGKKYHVVDRQHVKHETTELQRYILELSGLLWEREPYFPKDAFVHEKTDDDDWVTGEFVDEWYSSILSEMKEPSLWKLREDPATSTALRLLWVPPCRHPISIRIIHSGDSTTLHVVELDGAGGDSYDPAISS